MGFAKMTELHEVPSLNLKIKNKYIYAFIETGDRADYYSVLSADSDFMPKEGYVKLNAAGTKRDVLQGFSNQPVSMLMSI